MRTTIARALALALVGSCVGIGAADAASHKKPRRQEDGYAQRYPTATPRQLRNARAYDRGEYYEQDSNAHPVGSRGWWELKERESGGGRFRF